MSDIDEMIKRLTERQRDEFALKCARRAQHLMRDPRSIAALDTRERWLRGEATDEEMTAARSAAMDAWREARSSLDTSDWAWAACGAVDGSARIAAQAGAWSAGEEPPSHKAWDAERAWQRAELERILQGGGAC